jgi:hypothetical protein
MTSLSLQIIDSRIVPVGFNPIGIYCFRGIILTKNIEKELYPAKTQQKHLVLAE